MNKHIAWPTARTRFIEATYRSLFGTVTPDRNGRRRKEANA
jgi:hypothetical protein